MITPKDLFKEMYPKLDWDNEELTDLFDLMVTRTQALTDRMAKGEIAFDSPESKAHEEWLQEMYGETHNIAILQYMSKKDGLDANIVKTMIKDMKAEMKASGLL